MNPDQHPPINVLCAIRGFDNPKLAHKITPYRIHMQNGQREIVEEIRHCTRHPYGKSFQYQYVVRTKNGHYLEIWLDVETFSWRITGERTAEGIIKKH
jgi:hypothetical protein